MQAKHRGKGDLINITNSSGKMRSFRWMPKQVIEK